MVEVYHRDKPKTLNGIMYLYQTYIHNALQMINLHIGRGIIDQHQGEKEGQANQVSRITIDPTIAKMGMKMELIISPLHPDNAEESNALVLQYQYQ